MPRKKQPEERSEDDNKGTPQDPNTTGNAEENADAPDTAPDLKTAEMAFEEQKPEHHAHTAGYASKEADACVDINEGIPTNPLPKEGLPPLKKVEPEDEAGTEGSGDAKAKKGDAKAEAKRKDGMEKALDILEEYYDDTPPRDPRFQHDEE